MLRRTLLVVLAVAFFSPAARALDPELAKPYRLDVVLDVARHRLLTDVFRQQVRREIQDGLRAPSANWPRCG